MKKRLGFAGLGQMGRWMAINMAEAGFDVTVFDKDADAVDYVAARGTKPVESAIQLAGESDWIFLSLPDALVVEDVIFGPRGLIHGATEGSLIVDCGTTAYLPTLEFHRRLKEKGIRFADAPVSGMEARARQGDLTVMYGGEKAVFDEIRPVLEAIGGKVLYMGDVGSGQLAKLINQLLFNISCAAIAEVLPMAAKLGLDPEKVTEVVTSGTGRSFAAEFFAPLALENVFDKGYPLKHAYKDMISAAGISANEKIPLPLVHAATTTYQMALAAGYGEQGKGAMIKVFEDLLGVKFRKKGSD
jgi:3-hydroxyisobutyrate dehydrogenase-like beta-hydroxyacid dehydrogenase